jgi:hypothetical protein
MVVPALMAVAAVVVAEKVRPRQVETWAALEAQALNGQPQPVPAAAVAAHRRGLATAQPAVRAVIMAAAAVQGLALPLPANP